MHRADPFMLDDDIAEDDDVPKKSPPVAAPVQPVAPAPPSPPSTPAPPPPSPVVKAQPPEPPKAKRGRPKSDNPKRQITLRLDAEIIDHFKGTGRGWQTRINSALREAAGLKCSAK